MSGSPPVSRVLATFAVEEEAGPFRRMLPPHVTVLVTGMGAAAASLAVADKLGTAEWDLVVTCGFAGGLDPALTHGAVLLESADDFPLRSAILAAGAKAARFHCAERVAVTAYEKAALRERTGADAVEMESSIIGRLCRDRAIPCATVRVISDTAKEDLPLDFNLLMKADGRISLPRLARAVLCRPGKIPALMALGRHTSSAARQLAAVLHKALAQR